jgi:hypothetical protein
VDRALVPGLVTGFQESDPDLTASVGEAQVTVDVTTYGNACREKGELRIAVSSETQTILVAPFDWLVHLGACDDILRTFHHTATVNLTSSAGWTLRLVGLDISRQPFETVVVLDTLN